MMAVTEVYTGATTTVLVQEEATWGTDPGSWAATDTMGMLTPDVTHTVKNNLVRGHTIGNRNTQYVVATRMGLTGSISGTYQLGRMLAFGLGSEGFAAGPPAVHTLTPTSLGLLPSFSMLVSRGQSTSNKMVETLTGCMISGFRISSSLDTPVEVSLDFMGQTVSDVVNTGATGQTVDTDDVQPPVAGYLKIPNSGAATAQVQNLELNCQNNLVDVYGIGNRLVQGIYGTTFTTDFKATVAFNDDDALQIFKDVYSDSASPYTPDGTVDVAANTLEVKYTNGGAAGAERSLEIDLAGFKWDELSVPTRVGEITMMELTGQATTVTSIKCTDAASAYLA